MVNHLKLELIDSRRSHHIASKLKCLCNILIGDLDFNIAFVIMGAEIVLKVESLLAILSHCLYKYFTDFGARSERVVICNRSCTFKDR